MRNARIGANASVTSALVCEGAVIHESATVGKGAIIAYDVVVGAGHVVADYSRISLAPQPAHDDDVDSDDELEIGSFGGGGGARLSDPSRQMARSDSKGSFGGGGGFDEDDDEGPGGVFLTDHERALLQRAKEGTAGDATTERWAPEGVGVGGAGHAWAPRWGEEEWRFSIAPVPPGSSGRRLRQGRRAGLGRRRRARAKRREAGGGWRRRRFGFRDGLGRRGRGAGVSL